MEKIKTLVVENESQLQRCLAIRREVFIEEQQVPEELEIDEYDVIGSATSHVLVTDSEQDMATGRLTKYPDGSAKMQRIAVRSAYRGTGLGRVLVQAMEQAATAIGCQRSVLDSQCHAEGFYRSLGYRTLPGEPFYDAGILHVRMEKDL
ncbi:GNAT family N-acetyltransferase [Saccharibacillus sp. JS10]|uniref:GNAT family N-acetyltransferase n=1 Tax=Saccharibacillus sp. JS10 TaxID=2950552 RepID=UPI0021092D7C|nr:GNAT family N-acetyltransferase [Saccharibacillus sp. JS10]